MGGPSVITFEQIKAYTELTGNKLTASDIKLIRRLDQLYLKVMNE